MIPGDLIWVVNGRVTRKAERLNYTGPLIILSIDDVCYIDTRGMKVNDAHLVQMLSGIGIVSAWSDYIIRDLVKETP